MMLAMLPDTSVTAAIPPDTADTSATCSETVVIGPTAPATVLMASMFGRISVEDFRTVFSNGTLMLNFCCSSRSAARKLNALVL